jgi:hypothetical protein
MGFAEEMAEAEEAYLEAEAASGPPLFSDGKHQAALTLCRVENGQFGWQLVLGFRGVDANTGKPASIRKWHNLPPEPGREGYVKQDLNMLDYEGPLSGVEAWCISEAAIGLLCDIGVVTKPGEARDYTNVYINRVHGKVDVDTYAGGPPTEDAGVGGSGGLQADDDIPF